MKQIGTIMQYTFHDAIKKKAFKISNKITNLKQELKNAFMQTQHLIYTSYFNHEFNNLTTTQEIEIYRAKLYNYQNFIGITENNYDFNNYYIHQMAALEERYNAILNNVALVAVKDSKFARFMRSLKKLFAWNGDKEKE